MVKKLNCVIIQSCFLLLMMSTVTSYKDTSFVTLGEAGGGLVDNYFVPKLSFEEEYRLFEQELENGTAKHKSGRSRSKRYVYLNTEANVDVGFLVVIPITVVLPSMTNLFNQWRRKRSVPSSLNVTFLEPDSVGQLHAERIASYFDLIDIPETSCQLRAICEFTANPTRFFPLSDIIINKLRDQSKQSTNIRNDQTTHSKSQPSLLDLYTDAADTGTAFGAEECQRMYKKKCKYSINELLNTPVLKFWNKLQNKLSLKFDDVSEFSIM